jgi:hypothetical protein
MRTQVTFDAADPNALAAFWANVLDMEVEDHSDFVDQRPRGQRVLRALTHWPCCGGI